MNDLRITSPRSPQLPQLCALLAERADEVDRLGAWPAASLSACAAAGVFEWFLDSQWGGQGWAPADVVRGYHALAAACLTTAFTITQRTGGCRRLAASENEPLKEKWLPLLARGDAFTTVGISHLTTSRQHLGRPALVAEPSSHGWVLNGYSPWVTGADAAELVLVGAQVASGSVITAEQVLLAVPTDLPGVVAAPPMPLVGLGASRTGELHFSEVHVPAEQLVAGPAPAVLHSGKSTLPGGYETSTLALGLVSSALDMLTDFAAARPDLEPAASSMWAEHDDLIVDLVSLAKGNDSAHTIHGLRAQANSLALRATQATLAAAKGTGYVAGHPAGRWCREALFFLVWSCPQNVMQANLCELAGLGDSPTS